MGLVLRALEYVCGGLAITLCLMLVTIPLAFSLAASGLLVCLLSFANTRHAVALVSSSFLLTFGLLEIGLRAIPSDTSPHYYRPHELLAGQQVEGEIVNYKPNQSIEGFRMQAGDLATLASLEAVAEPRTINFHTDSLGFRNRQDYTGQRFVLFGDSFVVGNGSNQDAILSEVLMRDHGIPNYNAGYPGEIDSYEERFMLLQRAYGADFKGVVVVYEGNDFPCVEKRARRRLAESIAKRTPARASATTYIPNFVRKLESYRLFFGLTRRLWWVHFKASEVVVVEEYGGRDVAFLASHVQKVKQPKVCAWNDHSEFFQSIANHVALVMFVPTKYRVYASLPQDGRVAPPVSSAATHMAELARDLSFPYLDLTSALIAESERLLQNGQYTYWRDDTHWNQNGIRIAAAAIADHLHKQEDRYPDRARNESRASD